MIVVASVLDFSFPVYVYIKLKLKCRKQKLKNYKDVKSLFGPISLIISSMQVGMNNIPLKNIPV